MAEIDSKAGPSLADDSEELKTLQERRAEVEKVLRDHFEDCSPTIRYGGSKAKGTMIKEAYDLDIIRLLERPILPLLHGQKLIYTHPGTSFHILLNASLVLGLILAAPVIVGQIWGFLAPALYAHEKRVVVPVLVSMVALFLAGVALSYFVVLPLTLRFLMSIESTALTPMISATDYFDFAISMCLAFGLVFALAIPLYVLYELSVFVAQFAYRKRQRREARREAESATPESARAPA